MSQAIANTARTDDQPPQRYTAALANAIEAYWQDHWDQTRTFAAPNPGEPDFDAARPKKFILDMFPYPSGAGLHVGHPLGYIATDIYARYLRMTGHNVLHAMGFDSFGLPAEQYAIQTNTHPRITTEKNIATMKRQLRRLGLGHDPRRGVSTTDEPFYRWTQWIFLQIYNAWFDPAANKARPIAELVALFASGKKTASDGRTWAQLNPAEQRRLIDSHRLAYLDEVPVNWCPMLGTVLANEEVTADGRSERGNYPVYRRPLKQWIMRITAYAERLLADLEPLNWPEPVKLMQRNWIGKSEGAYVDFPAANRRIRVFTTRPDTLHGATYLVLSPEHELVDRLVTDKWAAGPSAPGKAAIFPGADQLLAAGATPRALLDAYRAYARTKTDEQREGGGEGREKTGTFIGAFAVNPVNNHRIPIFVADYVLAGYGTGAIMAVPGHDERDFAFAQAFGVPILRVVKPTADSDASEAITECFSGEGFACNSPIATEHDSPYNINNLPTPQAKARITAALQDAGFGRAQVNYKLRDWLFSRQRYWGEPFPIVFNQYGEAIDLPESMLPVLLPEMENFQPESSDDPNAPPRPPLARAREWCEPTLDLGDGPRRYTRETNTMPNWAGSCWYYLRYLDPDNAAALVGKDADRYWMGGSLASGTPAGGTPQFGGVDLYVGGVEHAVLHLLYARFWHKVLFDLGHVSTPEPFNRLFSQGYIQAAAYTDARGVYVPAAEVTQGPEVTVQVDGLPLPNGQTEPVLRSTTFYHNGQPVFREYGKMGKSLKNAVAPDEVGAEYGWDTLRVYEMSMGPLEASKPWNTRDIAGAYRFLQRTWRIIIDEQTGQPRTTDTPAADADAPALKALHKTILGVRKDMETLGFNTAVSKLIELTNELTRLYAERPIPRAMAEAVTLMLAPFAPHMAEELFKRLGHTSSLAHHPFPVADERLAVDSEVELPIQVNGKVRGKIMVPAGIDKAALEKLAADSPAVTALLEGKPAKKIIAVPGRMISVVV